MPLEIALISGDKYLLVRTYMNDGQATTGNKYLVLLTRSGNITSKYSTNADPINAMVEMLNEMKSI